MALTYLWLQQKTYPTKESGISKDIPVIDVRVFKQTISYMEGYRSMTSNHFNFLLLSFNVARSVKYETRNVTDTNSFVGPNPTLLATFISTKFAKINVVSVSKCGPTSSTNTSKLRS